MRRFDVSTSDFETAFAAFLAEPRGSPADIEGAVIRVIDAVRSEGAAALIRFSREFDRVELAESDLLVSEAEIVAGAAACPPQARWIRPLP